MDDKNLVILFCTYVASGRPRSSREEAQCRAVVMVEMMMGKITVMVEMMGKITVMVEMMGKITYGRLQDRGSLSAFYP